MKFGNGDGTFRSGPISEVFDGYPGVNAGLLALADVNRDGKLDAIFTGYYNYQCCGDNNYVQMFVALGNGDGTFQRGTFYQTGTDPYNTDGGLVVADFNKDGNLDVAQVANSGVWLFLGKGDGTFQPAVLAAPFTAGGGASLAMADFNLDGNWDLVVALPNIFNTDQIGNGWYAVLGNGDGTFRPAQHFTKPNRPFNVAAGKLGPKSFPGVALMVPASNSEPAYTAVYMGDGKGGFSGPQNLNLPGELSFSAIAIGDLNGDGIGDVVTGYTEAWVAYGNAKGGFGKPADYPIQGGDIVYTLTLADLRKNGRLDIVTDSDAAISVLLNQSNGVFKDGLFPKLPSAAGCGVAGDFNRDGHPDLAVNTSTGITILLGTGQAFSPFTVGQSLPLTGAGCLTGAGDLNGDGLIDLVITSSSGVKAYLGNGDGTFTFKSTTATPSFVGYLVLADFNHDGKLDFATCGNLLAYGKGDGTFSTPAPFVRNPSPYGYSGISVGDINGDGWPDLVLTNDGIPLEPLYVGLNNHRGGFTSVPQTIGNLSTGAVLVDLNGDGIEDMVLSNLVYLGDGTGHFTYMENLGFSSEIAGTFNSVADLNGDGIPDVVVLGTGTIEINLGLGNGTYAAPYFLGVGPGSGFVLPMNLHGQNPLLGLPDLVAPDETGGVTVLPNLTR